MEVECEVVDWINLAQDGGGGNHRLPLRSQYHPNFEHAQCICTFLNMIG